MNGEMRFKSYVLTRVASRDWCASRNVVSISSSCLCCRTALASPSGPFSSSTSRQPRGVVSRASRPTQSQSTVTNKQTHHDRHTYKLKLTTHSEVHNFFTINYTCCSHDVLLTDANNLAISPSLLPLARLSLNHTCSVFIPFIPRADQSGLRSVVHLVS